MAEADPRDKAVVAALKKAFDAVLKKKGPLPLRGRGGLFPDGPKGDELAKIAIDSRFLTSKQEMKGKGKNRRLVTCAVLTEKGAERVVDAAKPKAVLEALLPAVQALGKHPGPPNAEAFRSEFGRATETCVKAIERAFAKLEGDVLKAVAPPAAPAVDPSMVLTALQRALERVEAPSSPPVVPTASVAQPPPPAAASAPIVPAKVLEDAIVAFVNAWAKEKSVGCQFDVLWKDVKQGFSHLTIGTFQDALRTLHEARRIRLGGWGRTHDELPEPQLALFVSSRVMYYAQPGHSSG
jgi:hypothetical protein